MSKKKYITDSVKEKFLIDAMQKAYSADNFFACKTKAGDKWIYGCCYDYPLQHGDRREAVICDKLLTILIRQSHE